MTTNYLTCPIPAGHPSHAHYYAPRTTDDILEMLRNRKPQTHNENGFWLLDTAKETYKKLFKPFGESRRRALEKKRKRRRHIYAIFNTNMNPLGVYETKAEAVKLLQRDQIPHTMWGKPLKIRPGSTVNAVNPVPPGSTVIRIPTVGSKMNIDHDRYLKLSDPNFYQFRVAAKRCNECPRLNDPSALQCGCSLINNIRDQTPGWTLQTDHQLLMKNHRDRKKQQPVINIGLNDLF